MGNVSGVVESFDPVEVSTIPFLCMDNSFKTLANFKRHTLVPNSYKSISKAQHNLMANVKNHFKNLIKGEGEKEKEK